ncbi:R body protein RebB-like protein [Trinickia terrae]|uniref:R body protein RebB-like protein n=1 Tax=Trinickia terrae TaxID=2571161 RepID=A0A4U1HWK9_9BURK|nr:RebB family R body protein [Trinickia terrae]TKC86031.1 R body protein RebB-like protein [Trinickia terrae]
MAQNTEVNSQITDAVTQANVNVLAQSPAMAMGSLFQTMAHSTGVLFENTISAQQQQNALAQAGANMGVMQIYSVDTMADAAGTEKVSQAGVADNMTSMLATLQAFQNR